MSDPFALLLGATGGAGSLTFTHSDTNSHSGGIGGDVTQTFESFIAQASTGETDGHAAAALQSNHVGADIETSLKTADVASDDVAPSPLTEAELQSDIDAVDAAATLLNATSSADANGTNKNATLNPLIETLPQTNPELDEESLWLESETSTALQTHQLQTSLVSQTADADAIDSHPIDTNLVSEAVKDSTLQSTVTIDISADNNSPETIQSITDHTLRQHVGRAVTNTAATENIAVTEVTAQQIANPTEPSESNANSSSPNDPQSDRSVSLSEELSSANDHSTSTSSIGVSAEVAEPANLTPAVTDPNALNDHTEASQELDDHGISEDAPNLLVDSINDSPIAESPEATAVDSESHPHSKRSGIDSATNSAEAISSELTNDAAIDTARPEVDAPDARNESNGDIDLVVDQAIDLHNGFHRDSGDVATAEVSEQPTLSVAAAVEEADKYRLAREANLETAATEGDTAADATADLANSDLNQDTGSNSNTFGTTLALETLRLQSRQGNKPGLGFEVQVDRASLESDQVAAINASGTSLAAAEIPTEFDGSISLEDLLTGTADATAVGLVSETIGEAVESAVTDNKSVYLEIHPQELGFLTIEVSHVEDAVEAKIIASEMVTSELLMSHRDQLVQSLQELGYESLDVDISFDQHASNDAQSEQQNNRPSFGQPRMAQATIPMNTDRTDRPSGLDIVA
ncbi:flagellar hook-length control protein FliK [Roseiconus lacunae]|uniref:flagellar hook-length control protein FliK n=1 Tax=Roseiconus lacunae TaxID=2605694 RepID=UPI0011F1D51E|nr:flagellar hook-length control protein FliK [Roseiconus lacunae]